MSRLYLGKTISPVCYVHYFCLPALQIVILVHISGILCYCSYSNILPNSLYYSVFSCNGYYNGRRAGSACYNVLPYHRVVLSTTTVKAINRVSGSKYCALCFVHIVTSSSSLKQYNVIVTVSICYCNVCNSYVYFILLEIHLPLFVLNFLF